MPLARLQRNEVSSMATRKRPVAKSLAEYKRKRDFKKTAEPEGGGDRRSKRGLRFVVQKHAASHLHFDFRLELDGVMKSWAVPKGPSYDPSARRLAMEVEDHPIEYNTFEGTIPKGQYGGGTVMLWDRGTYEPEAGGGEDAVREGYERGDLKFILHGERLRGSWVLVRMRRPGERRQWLLIKHRDEFADLGIDVAAEVKTSVTTGRTMEEIASGRSRVWQSNRTTDDGRRTTDEKRPTAKARRTAKVAAAGQRPTAKRATAKRAKAKRAKAKTATRR
jgi:bifunctional non-homologous end joining protein LigD